MLYICQAKEWKCRCERAECEGGGDGDGDGEYIFTITKELKPPLENKMLLLLFVHSLYSLANKLLCIVFII